MPKTKSENKPVEIKMDTIGIQIYTIKTGIELNILSATKMNTVRINLFKYLMKNNLEIFIN